MPRRRKRLLTELYPKVATELLTPLVQLLTVARDICGGDVDKFLIILVVAIRTTQHPAFKDFSQADLLAGKVPVMPSLGTNMRSVAASVGIPKETARRKLAEIYEAGWLVREGRDIRFTGRGYQELAPVREAIEALALRYAEVVEGLFGPGGAGSAER